MYMNAVSADRSNTNQTVKQLINQTIHQNTFIQYHMQLNLPWNFTHNLRFRKSMPYSLDHRGLYLKHLYENGKGIDALRS